MSLSTSPCSPLWKPVREEMLLLSTKEEDIALRKDLDLHLLVVKNIMRILPLSTQAAV